MSIEAAWCFRYQWLIRVGHQQGMLILGHVASCWRCWICTSVDRRRNCKVASGVFSRHCLGKWQTGRRRHVPAVFWNSTLREFSMFFNSTRFFRPCHVGCGLFGRKVCGSWILSWPTMVPVIVHHLMTLGSRIRTPEVFGSSCSR